MNAKRATMLVLPLILAACGGEPGAGDPAGNTASTVEGGGVAMPMNEDMALADNAALAPLPEPPVNMAAENAAMPGIDAPPVPPEARPSAPPSPEPEREAAARIVRLYYARIAKGDFQRARAMWDDNGNASGLTTEAFAKRFARFASFGAEVGTADHINAGAGQRYVEVPVRVFARLKDEDTPIERRGIVTLHRTGDIEGATPAQRQWRIAGAEVLPKSEPTPRPTPEATPTPDGSPVPQPVPQEAASDRVIARYDCANGVRIVARFDNLENTVTLRRGYRIVGTLAQVRSGSGIWYRGEDAELRGKGNRVTITLPGEQPIQCQSRSS